VWGRKAAVWAFRVVGKRGAAMASKEAKVSLIRELRWRSSM
jgi:hypothetical protein